MDYHRRRFMFLYFFFFLTIIIDSSSVSVSTSLISAPVFDCDNSNIVIFPKSRNLLQAKKNCPVSFEFLNYSIIISQCKGPRYPPEPCCNSFKRLACPYTTELNDLTNDCATTLFSYINLYGKYPPGLFASQCREGKLGLECPPEDSTPSNSTASSSSNKQDAPFLLLLLLLLI